MSFGLFKIRKKIKQFTCGVCEKEFNAIKWRKYCGERCRKKVWRQRSSERWKKETKCGICGKGFNRRRYAAKYCGPNCRGVAVILNRRRRYTSEMMQKAKEDAGRFIEGIDREVEDFFKKMEEKCREKTKEDKESYATGKEPADLDASEGMGSKEEPRE